MRQQPTRAWLRVVSAACAIWVSAMMPAVAATHATLDRSQVALGDTLTLDIQTDQQGAPDYSPLQADFAIANPTSSRQVQMSNGMVSATARYGITLTPRRAGQLLVPALRVGNERTAPLSVAVAAASDGTAARGNAAVFIETEVDDASPYVQQSVGVTLRFFYATPLASGQLDLDAPQGASLQRVGEDVPGRREINGRLYNVVERRFLLIPDRSGAVTLPAPRFSGQGAASMLDEYFGASRGELHAAGAARVLDVRPIPANAPQPWLPLRDLRLRYTATPQAVRAGAAATLVVEATATGATRAQFPELPTPAVAGAQVFAEPPQYDETFVAGSPVLKLSRRYSIVPSRDGALSVPGLKLDWWSVRDGAARVAQLPDLQWQVGAGSGNVVPQASPDQVAEPASAGAITPAAPLSVRPWPWIALAVGFALLWLLTLAWALRRRLSRAATGRVPANGGIDVAGTSRPTMALVDLKRAIDGEGLAEIGEVLRRMRAPPATDLDAVREALADPAQREAVEQLRRAQWRDGDAAQARQALRAAFRQGPRWRQPAMPETTDRDLPPLYPER